RAKDRGGPAADRRDARLDRGGGLSPGEGGLRGARGAAHVQDGREHRAGHAQHAPGVALPTLDDAAPGEGLNVGSLSGKVAGVTGASRGVGKGAALALADEGATVYVTGRTVTPGSYPLPGTVGETAAEVDRRGGRGIAVRVDHGRDDEVAALFE